MELDKSFCAAARVVQHHAKSFYFSSFPLPAAKRRAAYAVYAFCRHCDDVVDRAEGASEASAAASELGGLLSSLYQGAAPASLPWGLAFSETVHRYGIEQRFFSDLIEGVRMDALPEVRIANWSELERYCYHVASVVGLAMAPILGMSDPGAAKQAADLGTAMQLTNILRDVVEDFENRRIYLPADELERAGLPTESLPDFASLEWKHYAKHFVARASKYYGAAESGIPSLANDGSQYCAWCMRWIYAGILDRIEEADYDVSVRRSVPMLSKVALAMKAWASCRASVPVGRLVQA